MTDEGIEKAAPDARAQSGPYLILREWAGAEEARPYFCGLCGNVAGAPLDAAAAAS
jgi:hypothetical protein